MDMVNAGIVSLIPGLPMPPQSPLARYHPFQLNGVVREFVESATHTHDMILVIGAGDGVTISEIVGANRRVVAMIRNPLDLLCTSLHMAHIPAHELQVALTQLADQPKAGRPFLLHVRDLYQTSCPRCQRAGTAEWFAWDRESGLPFAKRVRCTHCEAAIEGPVSAQDITKAGEYPTTVGPAYHLALSRATAHSTDHDPRIAQLIQLYTSRNLAVLMDIVNRLPRLHLRSETAEAMIGLLADAFDQGSSLLAYGAPEDKPRSLRPPQRFLERNVWMILEAAVRAYPGTAAADQTQGIRHDILPSILARPQPGYLLLNRSVQELDSEALAAAFEALIVIITPPEAAFWALSTLWSIWLWGDQVPNGLKAFLKRRRLDWEWYRRSLAVALKRVRPMLAPGAPVLMLTDSPDTAAARAAVYAAGAGDLEIERWLICPPHGLRLAARFRGPDRHSIEMPQTLDPAMPADVIEQLLQERGEPMDGQELTTAAILQTRDVDFPQIERNAYQASGGNVISKTHLWLHATEHAAQPLADRVEDALLQHLALGRAWRRCDLMREVYAEFNGISTPALEVVDAIIEAYTIRNPDGGISLRPEDDPTHRRSEIRRLSGKWQQLGERLGYHVTKQLNGDLIWRDAERIIYVFRFSETAILGSQLLHSQPVCDGVRCLVTPGGRAALIALKLRRDPRLRALAEIHHWTFIKFRHLRRMIEEITQRTEIEVYLGLDPIVEQTGAQIPLPFDMTTR